MSGEKNGQLNAVWPGFQDVNIISLIIALELVVMMAEEVTKQYA